MPEVCFFFVFCFFVIQVKDQLYNWLKEKKKTINIQKVQATPSTREAGPTYSNCHAAKQVTGSWGGVRSAAAPILDGAADGVLDQPAQKFTQRDVKTFCGKREVRNSHVRRHMEKKKKEKRNGCHLRSRMDKFVIVASDSFR